MTHLVAPSAEAAFRSAKPRRRSGGRPSVARDAGSGLSTACVAPNRLRPTLTGSPPDGKSNPCYRKATMVLRNTSSSLFSIIKACLSSRQTALRPILRQGSDCESSQQIMRRLLTYQVRVRACNDAKAP